MEGVGGVREACGPSKFSIPKTSEDKLQLEPLELLLFDNNKVNMVRKPRKKQKENPVGCTGERKDEKEIREEYREDKTETACI